MRKSTIVLGVIVTLVMTAIFAVIMHEDRQSKIKIKQTIPGNQTCYIGQRCRLATEDGFLQLRYGGVADQAKFTIIQDRTHNSYNLFYPISAKRVPLIYYSEGKEHVHYFEVVEIRSTTITFRYIEPSEKD